jgi:hypothetical protein
MALKELSDGGPDGVRLGQDTSDLIGFYGTTPVAQQGGSALATITLTTIATLDSGFSFKTSDGFNQLIAQVEAIRLALVNYGLAKTS